MEDKAYLGDSVYIRMEGNRAVIYLDNGLGPKNEIVLEEEVVDELLRFLAYH